MRPLRAALACAALLALVAPVAWTSAAYTPPAVIKIGAALPLSGPLQGAGARAWMLMNLSLSTLATNLPGYLPNTTLELVVVDTESTQAGMVRATLSLAAQGVAGLMGAVEGMNLVSNQAAYNTTAGTVGVGVGSGGADASVLTWMANSLPEPLNVVGISSTTCMSRAFSDTTQYPYLCRLCVKMTAKARAMLDLFASYGWSKMAILAQDGNDGWGDNTRARADPIGSTLAPGQAEADYLVYELGQQTSEAEASTNTLRLRMPSITSLAVAAIPTLLAELKASGFRIIVLYLQGDLLKNTMRQAAGLGMLQYPYVWIGAGGYSGPASAAGMGTGTVVSGGMGTGLCSSAMVTELADLTPSIPSVDSSVGTVISTFKSSDIGAASSGATYVYQTTLSFTSSTLLGTMCFVPAVPRTPAFTNIRYALETAGLDFTSILDNGDASAYDSIIVYAAAIDALIKAETPVSSTGIWSSTDMFNAVKAVNLTSEALMPNLQFDSVGDGYDDVDIYNYDPYGSITGTFSKRGVWKQENNGTLSLADGIIFSDGTTTVPPDHVDEFTVGEALTYKVDSGITALVYFFVLLPALIFIYNTRILAKSFIEGDADDRQWLLDGARAFGFFSLCGVFASVFLSFLSITYETGSFTFGGQSFAGSILLAFFGIMVIVPAPLILETWFILRKGGDAVKNLREDFELHMDDGEEIQSPGAVTKGNKDADKEAKAAALAAKEKARAARAKAKSGRLIRDDSESFLQFEFDNIVAKTTPGLALSSLLFAAFTTAVFFEGIDSLLLPASYEVNGGSAFGIWILEAVLLHIVMVRAFKDSRNWHRVGGAWLLSAIMMMAFHANMACVTFRYTGTTATPSSTVDQGGVAIAHAILFAIPFFAGLLQLIKALKLSRHSLDSVLNGMKSKLASLEQGLEQAKSDRKQAAADADHLKRLLELSNLCRPLHRNHALAFTMAENTGSGALDSTIPAATKQFVPASFMVQETAAKKGASQGAPNNSQGVGANNISGLDFGFLARPKAEMTGYKLLNELSLELFLASGPVHHRAVADIHLSHILSHPLTLELFKDTLTRPTAQETLAFWLDIQRFKQIADDTLRRTIGEAMVATFLYSDAPHPINCLTPASREQLLNVIFAKKGIKASSFHFIEQELLVALKKDYAAFVTSTGFKVCAFLLGHSSYRPSTRIKTLNPGGAVVGDGGKLVPMTQNQAPVSAAVDQSAAASEHDDPHSSVMSNFVGKSLVGGGAEPSMPDKKSAGVRASPAAGPRGKFLGAGTTGGTGGKSPGASSRKTGSDAPRPVASSPATPGASPSGSTGIDDTLDLGVQPILVRNASDPTAPEQEDEPSGSDDAEEDNGEDEEKKPLSPNVPGRKLA